MMTQAPLIESGDLQVYLADAVDIPDVLQEIGRLREITFRAVGEGTGNDVDLDRFDYHYKHLFVWNSAKREVVGAYRLAGTDEVRDRYGIEGLYTATLFEYGHAFLDRTGPALELGRSFIRPEYQRAFAPLLLLWKGIGRHVAANSRYRVLFGPVSISNSYLPTSLELIVGMLEKYAWLADWAGLVVSRNPFRGRACPAEPTWPGGGFDVDALSNVVSQIEPGGVGVSVLLRQYLRLGGKLLGFNIDPEFSNVVDGLILVDLLHTDPKLLSRYFGREEAAEFLAAHLAAHN